MSREKQIDEIRNDIFAAFGGYAKWEEDWQSLAEAVYNAGYRKQEWISVDERLPAEDTIVLVWCGEVSVYNYLQNDLWYTGYCDITTSESGTTHWMPLPEAPKMKGGAE